MREREKKITLFDKLKPEPFVVWTKANHYYLSQSQTALQNHLGAAAIEKRVKWRMAGEQGSLSSCVQRGCSTWQALCRLGGCTWCWGRAQLAVWRVYTGPWLPWLGRPLPPPHLFKTEKRMWTSIPLFRTEEEGMNKYCQAGYEGAWQYLYKLDGGLV